MLLLVDDEPLVMRAVCRLLGDRPFVCARSVAEAEDVARGFPRFSGYFVDPNLTGDGPTAGLDLLAWLVDRDRAATRVVITGRPTDVVVSAAARLDAFVLEKPVDCERFAAILAQCDANPVPPDPVAIALSRAAETYGLTRREVGLLNHIASGRVGASYRHALGIAETTYMTYRKAIKQKTGAESVETFVAHLMAEMLRRQKMN